MNMRIPIRDTDPWWFRAAYVLGVPTMIACFLIWVLAWRVDTSLTSAAKAMSEHVLQMNTLLTTQQEVLITQRQVLSVMQQICVNSAPTPQDRAACITAR